MRRKWTDELVKTEAELIAKSLGFFPSCQKLKQMGRNDLAVQITRRGGFLAISSEVGISRKNSDSDTGWAGEKNVWSCLESKGYFCAGAEGTRSPYDLIVNDTTRVDVKSAKYHEYGVCKGWFYRIGKYVQSDIVVLHQLDTHINYVFFWWEVTASNMTISRDGGKYASAKEAYWKIQSHSERIKAILSIS